MFKTKSNGKSVTLMLKIRHENEDHYLVFDGKMNHWLPKKKVISINADGTFTVKKKFAVMAGWC